MKSAASPILRWAGGKRRQIKALAPLVLESLAPGGRYIEPFLGGGALALHFGFPGMILNDAIAELVLFYRTVRAEPALVAWDLSALACAGVEEANYYRIRDMDPATLTSTMCAARTLYLNRLCFNGIYRVNRSGVFNVPYRSADAITSLFPHKGKLEAVSAALATSTILHGDFERVVDCAAAGDVVYCDPPYDGTFNGYTPGWSDDRDQPRLAAAVRRAHARGATVLVSNSGTARARDLYSWADVTEVAESRLINADIGGRKKTSCILAIGRSGGGRERL